MAGVAVVLVWLGLAWLDSWTDHGHYVIIPEVKGQSFDRATAQLRSEGFESVLSDSVYDDKTRPGTVIEQNPKSGTKVKEGREVYLTITAFSPKTVSIPSLTDVSLRQARSILEGLGFTRILVREVPSEYRDLVVGVKRDGAPVAVGTRLPVTSVITLEVGQGSSENADSIGGDGNYDLTDIIAEDE